VLYRPPDSLRHDEDEQDERYSSITDCLDRLAIVALVRKTSDGHATHSADGICDHDHGGVPVGSPPPPMQFLLRALCSG
jgi:hypothetical protein